MTNLEKFEVITQFGEEDEDCINIALIKMPLLK